MQTEKDVQDMQYMLDFLSDIEDSSIDLYDTSLDEILEKENDNWQQYKQFMEMNYEE